MKVKPVNNDSGEFAGYEFLCPGCGYCHVINTTKPRKDNGAMWSFAGDVNNPTFRPSINSAVGHFVEGQLQPPHCHLCNNDLKACGRCHFFITNGMIQFCGDSTHSLAGQTVALPDIKEKRIRKGGKKA